MNKKVEFLLVFVGILTPLIAFAQEDASRLEKRFEKPPEPKSVAKPLLMPIQEQVPPEQAGAIRFTLKELVISGGTVFSKGDMDSLYADLLGREVSLLDIYRIRDAITAKYGNAGFGLSKALVPEQRIQADGIVHIDILEGFVDEVIVEGATAEQQEFFTHAIAKIKSERPLNTKSLERYLLLANDRFSIKVTSILKKSDKTPSASTLILKVEPAPKVEGGASMDNRGTDAVGPVQFNGNISVNGLFGRPSQTTLGYATVERSSELQYWSLTHTDMLTAEGTALTLGWGKSTSKPGTPALVLLDQVSDSENWSVKVSHPFLRTRQENFSGSVKYDQKDTESRSLGAVTSQDKIRSIRFGISYDNADAYGGVNYALVEYSVGLNGWGATDNNSAMKSRADGRSDYQKITFNLSRKQELSHFNPALSKFSVNAALMGQYSGTGLLSSEECGIGGQQFGRAYDSSEILGDSCLAASFELRFTPDTQGTPFKYAQFYGFYDGGKTTNVNPVAAGDPLTKSLTSAGAGVRFGIGPYFTGSIEAAQPLTRIVANKGNENARIFANLSVRF